MILNLKPQYNVCGRSLGQASPCVRAFSAGQVAAHKIFEVIRRKSAIDIYDMSGTVLEDMKGEIQLRDVYFSYPTRPDQMIFSGFSLQVRSGMTMALIGESGSGKSTVISLVERFYDPQAGEVLIDGFNLKNLRLSWIRKKISLVSQEPVMFMTTIKDNIMYGKEDASAEEISRALNLANADMFISNMPYGLETMVGEHGTQLSGGQKQRIAIARAILGNPKILLLDEATSALDLESESIVHDALLHIMTDRTTIIVAHRLTTVKNADTISVLHKGRLVEQGSHSELIENVGGPYSQMVRLQDLTNEGEAEPSPSMNEMSPLKAIQKPATSHDHGHLKQKSMSADSSSRTFSLRFLFRSSSEVESCGDDSREINVGYNAEKEEKKGSFILRLILLNKPEIPALLAGTTAAAVNGVIFPLYGILLSSAIKTFFEPPHQLQKDAKFWALMHVVLGAVGFFIIPWQHYCFGVAGGRLVERIRSLLFQRTVHQEISWFDDPENSSGAIGTRLSRDASLLRNLVGDTLSFMVQNSSTVICGLGVAFAANWKLAFVILASIPLIGLQAYVQVKFLQGFSADAKMLYEEANQVASEAVGGIRTVASFCAEEKVMNAYRRKCDLPMRHGIQKGLISGLGYGFSSITLYCTYAFCFYVGSQLIQDGTTTPAQLFRVFFALMMTAMGVSETSAHGLDVVKAKEAAAAIFSVLDRKSQIDASVESGIVLADIKGEIEFQHVRFSYPCRPQVKIFTDLCIRMSSGKTVALVGESGSGKSTVIYLIERFSDPDSGTILIDGVEIRELKLSWLRQQMGLVSQEPVLFRGSIRSNIAYGKHGGAGAAASEDEIIAAAKAANAHAFISSLSHGYDTNVGERGAQLSGGQKQRIAIARAVIRNPRILLLDEATSALDAASEHIVQEALERVMLGRTTICIAHRLSTIQSADSIAVVKDGVIAEVGQHQALMSTPGGAYASLVSLHMLAQ
ncbi:ABC transporter B family member 11 [Platanthera zijinensis]|uniref:ABC transporter B family member 11 n=1 Tax=Platanthera zijinensis TaxID=2320716 RepID=A0AAP0BZN1_9ASPA